MKIEIPDTWLVSLTGCHPDTPVKEAVQAMSAIQKYQTRHLFCTYIGQYIVNQIMKDNYEKS